MKPLASMLKPRASVFADTTQEDVLNLTDFAEGKVDAEAFFRENYMTQGMRMLLDIVFNRFAGKSDTGLVKLTQAMGGGKTHCMIATGLLAQHVKLRQSMLKQEYADLGEIKVVTISGRENYEYGIWGSISEQLGQWDLFKEYNTQLKAPGENAWVNLLKGQKILILLDELPPYLDYARTEKVGNADLAVVTTRALSNLFSALGKAELSQVCVVLSDLDAAYEMGSQMVQQAFSQLDDLKSEVERQARDVQPVKHNSDEVYDIMRVRLFENEPLSDTYAQDKNDIAIAYKEAVAKARKLGITNYSDAAVYQGVTDSYPFHPGLKELYARFKENTSVRQTRGLLKLMRQIVRQFYESGMADRKSLIHVYDIDLNQERLFSMVRSIKPSLENAVSHDIAQQGRSVAESIDAERGDGKDYAGRMARMLLFSSLSTAMQGTLGLTENDACGFAAEPDTDFNIVQEVIGKLKNDCWYIKTDNRGLIYYQDTKNMVAEMNSLMQSYNQESARKELKRVLAENFKPRLKNCYQKVFVFPAVDEITLSREDLSLVIFEPNPGRELHPDLQAFWEQTSYKNRVMFLSGERELMEKLYENSKRLKAIQSIMGKMKEEHLSERDQQYIEAEAHLDKAIQNLFSTIRVTFVTLYYPTGRNENYRIRNADFKLEFKGNHFDGEEQIINCLKENHKYSDFSREDDFLSTLTRKCEQRLFTQKEMQWSQILDRAATMPAWEWYHPDQMETLRQDALKKDVWREEGGYLQKGPFQLEPTEVQVEDVSYDDQTKTFTLRVHGVGGNVYYDVGADPTMASREVQGNILTTQEPCLRFLCIDPTGQREDGPVVEHICYAPIKYGDRLTPEGRAVVLSVNEHHEAYYTTDGSEPRENGSLYDGQDINVPADCRYVRVVTLYNGKVIDTKSIPIEQKNEPAKHEIDEARPLTFLYQSKKNLSDTATVYKELEELAKLGQVSLQEATMVVSEKNNVRNYVDLTTNVVYTPKDMQELIDFVRERSFRKQNLESEVTLEYKRLLFASGAKFKEWAARKKFDLAKLGREGDIEQ